MISGFKKNKSKMVFAKDPKQAILALIVIVLFIGTSINSAIKVHNDSNPPATPPTQDTSANNPNPTIDINPSTEQDNLAQDANDIYSQTVGLNDNKTRINVNSPSGSNEDSIEIMTRSKAKGKMITVEVANAGRSNPFMPAYESAPKITPVFNSYLTPPPEELPTNNDAGRIMKTTISGILYDQYSPSAIINIEGSDYLVKKGDIINHYKILMIDKTQVMVQLGRNIYKAGVGELLSQANLSGNVANLNKKFGGNNNIPINVRKKSY